jgi:hypothetical protein
MADAVQLPTLRVGLSHFNDGPLIAAVRALGAPVLVSANAFAKKAYAPPALSPEERRRLVRCFEAESGGKEGSPGFDRSFDGWLRRLSVRFVAFRRWPESLRGLDCALDSAGYVAQAHYGEYLWSEAAYLTWAETCGATWVSAMDLCRERGGPRSLAVPAAPGAHRAALGAHDQLHPPAGAQAAVDAGDPGFPRR